MLKPTTPPPTCPDCGSTFTIDTEAVTVETYHPGYHVAGDRLPTRERRVTAAFCNGCERVVELKGNVK